ncbi:hypothetical protein LZ009_19240 [Ramlibacter sp. XY19]|uniref:hypothetical protein n=1 Tax=Ramlibacter paludis TaxID=2908000 RepID=UPI0023D9F382|nr:hypothetical protein [Ramlibacter paludis]MCG2594919.1 hypothetical protein [Ramlibacter paludis]
MKKLILPALLGLAALISMPSHALTASGAFDVTVNLYPKCEFVTAPSALALHYVSFQTTDSVNDMAFSLRCTNTLPYSLSFGGTAGSGGTLAGLTYALETRLGAAAATGGTGNGGTQSWAVRGTVAGGQGGNCAVDNSGTAGTQVAATSGANTGSAVGTACTATSASGAHTLTITY